MKYDEFLQKLREQTCNPSDEDKFKARIAEVANNFDGRTLDELNKELRQISAEHNRAPRRDFAGLSPEEMHFLLYHPLGENSPVRLRVNIADGVLEQISFLRLVEEFLKIVKRDGSIKLTAKLGTLPRKVLIELYDHHFISHWPIDDGILKLRHEDDWSVLGSLHSVVRFSNLVRKVHGKLVLTKLGERMLMPEHREKLFTLVLDTFTRKFSWAYNDFYPDFSLCQDAFGFSIYLLARFGKTERHKDFYAEKFLAAFPMILAEFETESFGTPESNFLSCYKLRTFDRFLEWFNFVNVRHEKETARTRTGSLVKRNEIMDAVFVL